MPITPTPAHLLGSRFGVRDLLDVHEAVAGTTLQKDIFRRAMEPRLVGTGLQSSDAVGRPSQLYRRARKSTRSVDRLS